MHFQAKDSARKMSEVQQNESYLRGRVEELEMTENMLRETLQQADLILAQREKKLRDQVCRAALVVCLNTKRCLCSSSQCRLTVVHLMAAILILLIPPPGFIPSRGGTVIQGPARVCGV